MLKKGYSRKSIGANIKKEEESGKSHEQAIAIALSQARKYAPKNKKRKFIKKTS